MLPPSFLTQISALLGAESVLLEAALTESSPVSIRLNPQKMPEAPLYLGQVSAVPWHPQGYFLPERPVFTLDPNFQAGGYYVQEASSMFLQEALRQTVDFSKKLRIMDLCAAPGGKSTLMASMLNSESMLVANEFVRLRVGALRENLEKWGHPNTAVVNADPRTIAAGLPDWFDVVVVDAPCSGEGMFRKDPDAIREWSPEQVFVCEQRQREILPHAVEMLAPGGLLVYSTCTFNQAENEGNAKWLVENFDLTPLQLSILPAWGIVETQPGGYRFFPHKTRGEGFFLSVFRKKEGHATKHSFPTVFKSIKPLPKPLIPSLANWTMKPADFKFFQTPSGEVLALPALLESDFLMLDKSLKNKWFGTMIGEFKGHDLVPAHALALSNAVSNNLPFLALSREEALRFLKKETFECPADAPKGWTLARFGDLNLGWIKVLQGRMNNYLPPERRIRMAI